MAVAFPLKPPSDWFSLPEAEQPTPLTFQKDGESTATSLCGASCHTGFLNGAVAECVQPPPSKTDYQHLRLGRLETEEARCSCRKDHVCDGPRPAFGIC